VRRIIVTTEDPEQYPAQARWAPGVEIWQRDRLDEAQRILRVTPGVTVLIHDQGCAAELRRLRKRGKAAEPATRVFINEAVCEGCGDCGVKSNCLSVQPVETEFGRKTQIHQSSCNKDYSCLLGDCPAFITVEPAGTGKRRPVTKDQGPGATSGAVGLWSFVFGQDTPAQAEPAPIAPRRPRFEVNEPLPEPVRRVGARATVLLLGIGGTGVVTVNQLLGTAALLEGSFVQGLDQTGLSQKGGPVVSHLKIAPEPILGSNKLGPGEVDAYLAFDILTATQSQNLLRAAPGRTIAVAATSQVPTGGQISSTAVQFPALEGLLGQLRDRADLAAAFDAVGLAESCFGDAMAANLIVLGAAFQAGALPVGAAAIERAIALNGVQVAMNTHAFRLGRRVVADPAWLAANPPRRAGALAPRRALSLRAGRLVEQIGARGELRRLLEIRVPELIAYQSYGYARQYAAFVRRVREAEQAAVPGQSRLSEAVARYLFKLMAYKDEYEVARLSLATGVDVALAELFGPVQRKRYHLHPPILRAVGMQRKLTLGPWFDGPFRLLMRLKFLRGTPLDLFGYDKVRRVERELIGEYRALIEAALADLSPAGYERAVRLAELPDMIRGYESIKLANVARFRAAVRELGFDAMADSAAAQSATG
jgi:indolepyruvate ferredoxin oxidoreductase